MTLEYFFNYILPHFVWLFRIIDEAQLPGYVAAFKSLILFTCQ